MSRDLPQDRPNPKYILASLYNHHIYMQCDVYKRQCTKDLVYSHLFPRCIFNFDEIPFFNREFF